MRLMIAVGQCYARVLAKDSWSFDVPDFSFPMEFL